MTHHVLYYYEQTKHLFWKLVFDYHSGCLGINFEDQEIVYLRHQSGPNSKLNVARSLTPSDNTMHIKIHKTTKITLADDAYKIIPLNILFTLRLRYILKATCFM